MKLVTAIGAVLLIALACIGVVRVAQYFVAKKNILDKNEGE